LKSRYKALETFLPYFTAIQALAYVHVDISNHLVLVQRCAPIHTVNADQIDRRSRHRIIQDVR